MTALVVDDLRTGRAVMQAALEARGWRVRTARSLAEAMSFATAPTIIVTDLNLPDSKGIATVRSLADAYPTSALHVASAATDDPSVVAAVQELGLPLHDKGPPFDWVPSAARADATMTDSVSAMFGPHWPTKAIVGLLGLVTTLSWLYLAQEKQQLGDKIDGLNRLVARQQDMLDRQQEMIHAINIGLAQIKASLGRPDPR